MSINTNTDKVVRKAIRLAESHQRTLAVDLDGTLAQYDGWKGVEVIGDPIQKVVDEVRAEKAKGSKIIIHTTRTNTKENSGYTSEQLIKLIKDWLEKHKIPFDEIWSGEGKPLADEYWDDRAVLKP